MREKRYIHDVFPLASSLSFYSATNVRLVCFRQTERCKWVKVNAGTPKIWTQTLPSELRIDQKEEHIADETSQLGIDFVRNVMKGVQMPTTAAVKRETSRNQEYRTKLCQEYLY